MVGRAHRQPRAARAAIGQERRTHLSNEQRWFTPHGQDFIYRSGPLGEGIVVSASFWLMVIAINIPFAVLYSVAKFVLRRSNMLQKN